MTTSRPIDPGRALPRPAGRRARRWPREAGFAALLVGVGADMRYLAGYPAMPLERLTMLVIPAGGDPSLVAPRLEATPARPARRPPPGTCRS